MTHFAGKAVRTLVLAVATVLILTASAFAAEDTMAVAVGSTTGSSLRLRSKASTSSSIVRVLDKGTAVAVLDKSIDGWYKIAYEGKTGYVCKVCGWIYEGEELPDDIVCPLCKHGAADFEKI